MLTIFLATGAQIVGLAYPRRGVGCALRPGSRWAVLGCEREFDLSERMALRKIMGDVGDTWQDDRTRRILLAGSEFEQAAELAEHAGLVLRQCSDAHYQLSAQDRSWHVNLYPSTFRIVVVNRNSAPRIPLDYSEEWTLLGLMKRLTSED